MHWRRAAALARLSSRQPTCKPKGTLARHCLACCLAAVSCRDAADLQLLSLTLPRSQRRQPSQAACRGWTASRRPWRRCSARWPSSRAACCRWPPVHASSHAQPGCITCLNHQKQQPGRAAAHWRAQLQDWAARLAALVCAPHWRPVETGVPTVPGLRLCMLHCSACMLRRRLQCAAAGQASWAVCAFGLPHRAASLCAPS